MRRWFDLRSSRLRRAIVPLVLTLVAVTLSACSSPSPKSAIGPSASPCFRTLPTARAAIGDSGHFLGVRLLSMAVVNADLQRHHDAVLPKSRAPLGTTLCVVGYHGSFTAASVKLPWPEGRVSGSYALVLIALSSDQVIATILLSRAPLHIGRI